MAGPTLFRPSSIPTGLVGYWKLDEASGNRADSSGNGNTLTDNNTVSSVAQDYWKSGENSADFESGNSEYLSIAHGSQTGLGVTSAVSMSAFVKLESLISASEIMAKYSTASKGYFFDSNSGTVRFGVSNDGSATTILTSAETLAVGKWYHLACVYDGASLRIYINGNLDSSVAYSSGIFASVGDFYLGAIYTASVVNFMDGLVKDAAIWNVALTPIQIKSLALGVDLSTKAYRPNNVSVPPTAWWKMNELSGNRADSSGNAHTLTDNNTVLASGGYVEGVSADFEASATEFFTHGDHADWDIGSGNFTVSQWVKFEAVGVTYALIGQWSNVSNQQGWFVQMANTNVIQFIWTNDGSTTEFVNASFTPVAETWYHIVVKRDGNDLRIYVDGTYLGGGSMAGETVHNSSGNFIVGATVSGGIGVQYMDGEMCDVAFWKGYALTDAEIKSLACGMPIQQTGIVSYWKLDETSGTRIDSIGANNLTDNNTVLSGTGKASNGALFAAANSESLSKSSPPTGLKFQNDYTVLFWHKPQSGPGASEKYLIYNGGGFGNGFAMVFSDSAGGTMSVYHDASYLSSITEATLDDTSWKHIAFSYSKAEAKWFLNSANLDTDAATSSPTSVTTDFQIGSAGVNGRYIDDLLDEMVIAERWFRPEEIKTIYCKGLCGKELTSEEIVGANGNMLLLF